MASRILRGHDRRVSVVRRCHPGDREATLRTVVDAFAADPLLRWVWPDAERYQTLAHSFFGLLLDLRVEGGEVWLADGGDAVAMWNPPGGLYGPPAKDRWAAVRAGFSSEECARWDRYDAEVSVPEDAGHHWYLGTLATSPRRLRQGLGAAVVAPMLAAADRTGMSAFLETANEANLSFYSRLGFTAVGEATMPDAGPRCWVMRREPDGAR